MLACFSCQTKRLIFSLFTRIDSVFTVFGTFVTDIDNLSLFHKPFIFIVEQRHRPAADAADVTQPRAPGFQ